MHGRGLTTEMIKVRFHDAISVQFMLQVVQQYRSVQYFRMKAHLYMHNNNNNIKTDIKMNLREKKLDFLMD